MMFDSLSLLILLFDSLLGLGGIFIIRRYFLKRQQSNSSDRDLRQECWRLRTELQQQSAKVSRKLPGVVQ